MKKTVCITGGNRGVGKALVTKFLEEGFYVFATSRNGVIPDLQNANLQVIPLEITSTTSIASVVQFLKEKQIVLDLLINNAGVGLDLHDLQPNIETVKATFATNVFGLIEFTEACIPFIAKQGTIFNISSIMGMLQRDTEVSNATAYRMSKSAVNMYTKTLAARLRDNAIKVVSIHPGWVKTDMGGENAAISPQESANGILALYQQEVPTGTFWTAENQVELNW